MLTKLAIWILRKRKTSVLIGYEVVGGYLKAINNHLYVYGNSFTDTDFRLSNGDPIVIPKGKFFQSFID